MQNDPFEQFADEPEVSSTLVVTSNTSEKLEKLDVDTSDTVLVVSSDKTQVIDCSDIKNNAAAMTGIAAGGAALMALAFPPATGALCLWSLFAGASTAANGAVNYMECPDSTSTFQTDWKRVQEIARAVAVQVYDEESKEDLVFQIRDLLRKISAQVFFLEKADMLNVLIGDLEALIRRFIRKDFGYQWADLLLTISGLVSDLHLLSLSKTKGTCSNRYELYRGIVRDVKEYMDTLLWMNARREFLSSVSCTKESGRDLCYISDLIFPFKDEPYYCDADWWQCESKYGNNEHSYVAKWRDCIYSARYIEPREMTCTDPSIKSSPEILQSDAKSLFVDTKFKPKYQKW